MGFTSACFAFAVGVLFICPAPLPHARNAMEQLFPSKDPFSQLWFGSHRRLTRVARLPLLPESGTDGGRVHNTSPALLLYGDTNWKPLSPTPLSLPLTLFLLAFSWTFRFTEGLSLAHSPTSPAFQAENTLNLQLLTPCPIHPRYENPDQPL